MKKKVRSWVIVGALNAVEWCNTFPCRVVKSLCNDTATVQ